MPQLSHLDNYLYNVFDDIQLNPIKTGGYSIQKLIHSNKAMYGGGGSSNTEKYEMLMNKVVPAGLVFQQNPDTEDNLKEDKIKNDKLKEENIETKPIDDELFDKLFGHVSKEMSKNINLSTIRNKTKKVDKQINKKNKTKKK
jgi:hypothetical protein